MKEIKIEKCPFCGGEEMIETNVGASGDVYVTPAQKGGLRSASLWATVCRDCGSVVRAYCKDPEKLFPKLHKNAARCFD